jgi:predicted extracellular nuclease
MQTLRLLPPWQRLSLRLLTVIALTLFATHALAQSDTITPIHDIQGAEDESLLVDQIVTIEGIVTGDYQERNELRGFFVQEETEDMDENPATSEGIFVFNAPVDVNEGDQVRVSGTVVEVSGMTQIIDVTSVTVLSVNALSRVSLTSVDLPIPAELTREQFWEQHEGLLVFFRDTLSVAEYFELGRYGRIVLTEGGRPYQFTQTNAPDGDYAGFVDDLSRRTVILDDFNNTQNRADVIYHPQPGFSPTNYFRGGDTVNGLVGIVNYAGEEWRIEPTTSRPVTFTPVNPRPDAPIVRGSVQVASFNVLNYFNGNGDGTGFPTSRGADSPTELETQQAKIVAALTLLDADIVGLIEIENDSGLTQATADLVDGLNAAQASEDAHYAYIDTGVIGTDEIKVALLYRPAVVTPAGSYAILDSSIDPDFNTQRNRPALAQTFTENASGAALTVVVNHFKSKGSGCATGDNDPVQGGCAGTRTLAAQALARWLESDPTGSGDPDFLILGDLNAYAMEDPITALTDAGFVNLIAPTEYSYVFDGQLGSLDHALASESLASQVTHADIWNINADEISLLDYNDTVLDDGEEAYEAKPYPLTADGPWRSSDHDPIIVGFDLMP